jgi:hypothetical protein
MKITKKQLRKIIKEERARLAEYGPSMSGAERAIGSYFDMEMQKDVERGLRGLYDNAMEAALDDVGDELDAENMVEAGLQKLLDDFLQTYGRGG